MRQLLSMAVGFFVLGSEVSQGQTIQAPANIRIRLLNYKTGLPLKGRYVELALSGPDGKFPLHANVIRAETDANGVAGFQFGVSPAQRVWVIALDDYECAKDAEFATADILRHGIAGSFVDDIRCKPHAFSLPSPRPGEVVFPVHRLSLWQRILRGFE
jgi:hypothetical protein